MDPLLNIVVNRSLDGKFKKIEQMLEGYTELYAQKMAEQIVLRSPVDTGTYMDSHELGLTAMAPSESSEKKARNRPYSEHAQPALNKLFEQAKALPHNAMRIVFSNRAYHANMVEFDHGHAVYRGAANQHNRIAQEAEAEIKARFR